MGDSNVTLQPSNVETVIAKMGRPGPYQYLQLFIIFTCLLPQSFILISYAFIAFEPRVTCAHVNETELLQELNIWNSSSNRSIYDVSYQPCHVETIVTLSETPSEVFVTSCRNGYNYSEGRHSSIVSEWDLVCDSSGIAELTQTVINVGVLLGGTASSIVADKYGRKITTIISSIFSVIFELGVAFASNIYLLILFRFISGLFMSGLTVNSFVLGCELLESKHRETFGIVHSVGWSVCGMMFCGIAYSLRDSGWRNLQLCLAGIEALPLLFLYFLEESPVWYHSVGKYSKASALIQKACKLNRIDTVEDTLEASLETAGARSCQTSVKTYTVLDIFKDRKLLITSVVSWLVWFTNDVTYFGVYLTASTLVGDVYLNSFIMFLLEIPALLINLALLKFKGRRFVIMLSISITAVCLLISTSLVATGEGGEQKAEASKAFFLLGKFGISGSYTVLFTYTAEIFPTSLRSTSMGVCLAFASVGGMLAPYLLPLFHLVTWAPGTILSGLCFLTLVLLPILPETRAKQLPCSFE